MSLIVRALPLAMVVLATAGGAAKADGRLNSHPWDFQVHNRDIATSRATTMWQVERADGLGRGGMLSGSIGLGGGFGGVPGVGSVANMNVITVVVGDSSVVDVAVETEQGNSGQVSATATAITAIGAVIDAGATGANPPESRP